MTNISSKRFFAFGGNTKLPGESESRIRGHSYGKASDECVREDRQSEINHRVGNCEKRDDRHSIFRIKELEDADKK